MVGKTSISTRFIKEKFIKIDLSNRTINTNVFQKSLDIKGKLFNLTIWDTAGEEKYRSIVKNYYKGSIAAILVYDITNKQSFEEIKNFWYKEIKQFNPNISMY